MADLAHAQAARAHAREQAQHREAAAQRLRAGGLGALGLARRGGRVRGGSRASSAGAASAGRRRPGAAAGGGAHCAGGRGVAAQRGQADARGVEAAVHRQELAVDEAGVVAAQEADRAGHLLGRAVAAQRDRVLVVGADRHAVHELGHLGLDRARADRVDADADVAELDRQLLGQVQQRRLAGAVGHAQRAGAQARDRRDVDDRAAAGLAASRGTQACVHRKAPSRLVASTSRNSA